MSEQIDIDALFKVQYGMYIVSSKLDDKINGQIATTVMQVTNEPIQISVCLSKNTLTHEMIQQSGVLGVSILKQDTPMTFIGRFGYQCGREHAKCQGVNYEQNLTGCPLILDHTLVVLEAKVNRQLDIDTHTIFVGELLSSKQVAEGAAMTYEYYHTVIKGKSPKNAPTYVGNR